MMIDPARIQQRLAIEGFQIAYFDEDTCELLYVRRNTQELFERISVEQGYQRGGQVGDLVGARVECMIVPGRTALKGMGETECLVEIAADSATGWTALSNTDDAVQWEMALVRIAPVRAESLTRSLGDRILTQTEESRHAANEYLARCSGFGSVSEAVRTLKSKASELQLAECERILREPVIMIPGGREYYELSALVIAIYADEVEHSSTWLKGRRADSAQDRGLMVRLQIMASKLAEEPGW